MTDMETHKKLFDFGVNIGLAFQVTDDLLDFTKSSSTLGKPSFNDLKEVMNI